jgi:PAS domain S-box-containing protein
MTESKEVKFPVSEERRNVTPEFLTRSAWQIAVGYIGFAALWILMSDRVLGALTQDPEGMTRWAIVKGLAFVLITGGLLYGVLRRTFARILRVQAALTESEAHSRLLFETMTQGVVYQDAEGRITAANPAAERILGMSLDAMRGRVPSDPRWRTVYIDGTEFAGDSHPCMVALRSGEAVRDVVMGVFNPKVDDYVWININAVPQFRAGERRPHQVYTTFEDITAQRRAERERATLDGRLRQQERLEAIGQLAGGVAHDFNNLLMPIIGFPEMMLNSPQLLGDRQQVETSFRSILAAGKDAKEVVRRLREFYRPADLEVEPVGITDLVQQVVALTEPVWKAQACADGKTITVETEFHAVRPVRGNAAALRELLTNLLFNAVDAIPRQGTITVATTEDEAQTTIEVSDNGTGMDEAVRRHCFDPFFTTKGKKGSGLGLSVCYGVAASHGGRIDAGPRPGGGTTFTLRLPRVAGGTLIAKEPVFGKLAAGWRVLIVDDDDVVRTLLSAYATHAGCLVEMAGSGEAGLGKLRGNCFDVVITDLAMPGMDGGELAREVKRLSPGTAVLMVTGFGDLMNHKKENPEGVDEVIGKPVSASALLQAIERVVRRNPA